MPAGKTMVRRCSIQVNNELDRDVMISQRVLGAFYVGLSASCFGAMAIFARHAYAGGAEALAVLFVRFALAAGVMIVIMNRRQIRWPRGRALIILSLMGGVGYVSQSFSFFSALNHASAGLVALLLYLYPFIVIVIETVFMRRKLTRQRLVAVLLALSGTALILGQGLTGQPLGGLAWCGSCADLFGVHRCRRSGAGQGGPTGRRNRGDVFCSACVWRDRADRQAGLSGRFERMVVDGGNRPGFNRGGDGQPLCRTQASWCRRYCNFVYARAGGHRCSGVGISGGVLAAAAGLWRHAGIGHCGVAGTERAAPATG